MQLNDRLAALAAHTGALIAIYDPGGRIAYANEAFREAFFLEPDETPLWVDLMRRTPAGQASLLSKLRRFLPASAVDGSLRKQLGLR